MKKIMILLCVMLLLTGCCSNVERTDVPVVTEPTSVAVQTQAVLQEEFLSHELAMLEGYVVMDEGDVRHNAGNWVSFLDECKAGNSASVTVVSFVLEESGYTYAKYDLSFDGSTYTVDYIMDGEQVRDSSPELVYMTGGLESAMEPYDSYECYCLNDLVVYKDLIAKPDFEGVEEIFLHSVEGIFLHSKEKEAPIKTYSGDDMQPILELLWTAQYVPCEPENYVYGMKLLMTNRDGEELVIELDLKQGFYRYGMQNYQYGEVSDMFVALGIEQWPDSVLEEFGEFLE